MERWPALPPGIRLLSNEELARVRGAKDSVVPRGPDDCITCGGTGSFRWYARYEDSDERVIATYECPCLDQWIAHLYLLHCGIQKRYQGYSKFDIDAVDLNIYQAVKDYAASSDSRIRNGASLILRGGQGTGKTLLSTLLLKHLLGEGYAGYFTTFESMISLFSSGWKEEEEKKWFNRRALNAQVLLIDEVKSKSGERQVAVRVLEEVIRHRVASCLPTIITTNETNESLGLAFGSHFMNLMDEVSSTLVFQGQSYRSSGVPGQRVAFEEANGLRRPISVGRLV